MQELERHTALTARHASPRPAAGRRLLTLKHARKENDYFISVIFPYTK
jgi:hypothetical protein